jgi:thiamine biosynthesis protein ThiS
VNVEVNGKSLELPAAATVERLISELGLETRYALVERNGEPVERARYAMETLEEGDAVVVARPVAGG